jgi:hypothetical protein
MVHCSFIHIDVHVADMKDREPIEFHRHPMGTDYVLANFDALCISSSSPIKSHKPECISDNRRGQIPILEMKEIDPVAENALLMVTLDAETLTRIGAPQPAL